MRGSLEHNPLSHALGQARLASPPFPRLPSANTQQWCTSTGRDQRGSCHSSCCTAALADNCARQRDGVAARGAMVTAP
jgi:hypothetical protein